MSVPTSVRNSYRMGCNDVAKAMGISGIVEIIIIVCIFIILVFAAAYNNKADPSEAGEIEAKQKYINHLIVTAAIISLLLVGVGVWHLVASNNVKKCIGANAA